MSASMIALLHASAEPPGMPPFAANPGPLEDPREGFPEVQVDFISAEPSGLDAPQSEPRDAERVEGESAPESLAPLADEITITADIPAPLRDPDLWLYRDRTYALLRRYMRLSIEVGRMPSLLGREFFRSRVTSYKSSTFEDSVIFVHDIERSLEELDELEKKLIAKIVLQQYSKEEAGRLLGCGYRTIERLYPETLDHVSEILLRRRILTRFPGRKHEVPKSCQEGKIDENPASG